MARSSINPLSLPAPLPTRGTVGRVYDWMGSVDRDRLGRALVDRGPDVGLVLDRDLGDQHRGVAVVAEREHVRTERTADPVAAALVVVDKHPHRVGTNVIETLMRHRRSA